MKILSAQQLRVADQATILNEPITSINLMERAAMACFDWLAECFTAEQRFAIVCGVGNNGGDGLAIARMLLGGGKQVHVFVVGDAAKGSADFTTNLNKLDQANVTAVDRAESLTDDFEVIVDALFGTGLNKPVKGLHADVITVLNDSNAIRVAIDIPSGLFADDNTDNDGTVFKADYTLTFEQPKLAFFFAESAPYVGEFIVLPIGLDAQFIATTQSQNYLVEEDEIRQLIVPRDKFAHKGTYGHALLVGGSKGKIGAMVLSAKACIHTGAGLTSVVAPNCGYTVLQTAVPEAMCITNLGEDAIEHLPNLDAYNAIGIGPGMGTDDAQAQALKKLLNYTQANLVIDADAINILVENQTWLHFLPANCILTPHPGEFDRLAKMPKNAMGLERYKKQRELSAKYNCYIVLKGAYTSISCPDGTVFFNPTGNPGMATGGSGDVLTGIIAGLLAQRYKPRLAAVIGVYLHGLAGDLAAGNLSQQALSAGDIINYLPSAFKHLGQ
jgi:NAD(P)H-hydrate epimerase